MTNAISLPRQLIILGIVAPLAALLGYMLSDPFDSQTMVYVVTILAILSIPAVLKWHHPLLLLSWSSGLLIYFLPGQPQLWMLVCLISFGVTILSSTLNKEQKLINVSSITWTLLLLCLVVFITGRLTGGLGVRSLGGNVYGGKKYYSIFLGVIAYFAVSMKAIPFEKVPLYTALFFLGGLFLALSNLIYYAGPNFYFLYNFFPSEFAMSQALEEMEIRSGLSRLSGLGWAGLAGFCYMQMRYGIRGLLDLSKPWRMAVLLGIIGISLLGGFRSILILYLLILFCQYLVEGLWRTKYTVYLFVGGALLMVFVVLFSAKMPTSVQRSLSIIPWLQVDDHARQDAKASLDWRFRMWSMLYPEIPKYFWLGKGYTASPTDYHLAVESVRRGLSQDVELTLISGDYHNGPLSIIVPFGIWGVIAFAGFIIAAIGVLKANLRYGDPRHRNINIFLLSFFIARVIFFTAFFGAITSDTVVLAGILGLSVSINGGKRKPTALPQSDPEAETVSEATARPLAPVRLRTW